MSSAFIADKGSNLHACIVVGGNVVAVNLSEGNESVIVSKIIVKVIAWPMGIERHGRYDLRHRSCQPLHSKQQEHNDDTHGLK